MARKLLDSRRKIETRLAPEDHERFQLEARKRGITQTALAREAILDYLNNNPDTYEKKKELALAEQLRKATNRLASLLAKSSIDINTVARFIYMTLSEKEKKIFDEAHSKAVKRVKEDVTPEEKAIVDGIVR